ncbi:MAG: phospholipase D family protein, partial [Bacteroidaceae bacterium]|nr:phospholipase D family protein [Bacteroidaceae bacterium]
MSNMSLFDIGQDTEQITLSNNTLNSGKIDVVKMEFIEAETLSWNELFDGFDKMYAITYSSGIGFVCELLQNFTYSEIIFGCEEVMSYSLQEVMAYQLKTIERIRENMSKLKLDLMDKINDESLRMFVARKRLSHEKVYLLEAADGRKRTILGSANMSRTAFSGFQRENVCFIDGDKAFDWYMDSFEKYKLDCSDNISVTALSVADDGENLEEIPVRKTAKVQKALVIEPENELKEEIRYVLDIQNLSNKLSSFIPKADKKGKIMLSPENVKMTRRRVVDANIQEKELRSEYPQLIINTSERTVSLNGSSLDLSPDKESIKNDVDLFILYMSGYERFHGDIIGMQLRYFEFAHWFFTTPFMAIMRNMAVKYNQNLLPYPVFGLLYGQSKAGKTSFLETLLKMMIGQKTKISAPDFTRSTIENLKRNVMGAPIIVDDLTQTRFSQHAIETIKNDDFGVVDNLLSYPAVVISANEDVKAVAAE